MERCVVSLAGNVWLQVVFCGENEIGREINWYEYCCTENDQKLHWYESVHGMMMMVEKSVVRRR